MAIQLFERPNSRQSSGREPEVIFTFGSVGEVNEQTVHAYVLINTPTSYASIYGTLYRQDIQLDPVGFDQFTITVPYRRNNRTPGSYSWSFDTTGGTALVVMSKETRASYPAGAPDHKQLIDVQGDTVNGTEIVIPSGRFTVNFRHPLGVVTQAKMNQLMDLTGTVNDSPFFGRAAGEVLFLGATGSDGSDAEAELAYQFAVSKNATGLSFGDIAGVAKKGWDVVWVRPESGVDTGNSVKKPQFVYVERVYEEVDLATELGFG